MIPYWIYTNVSGALKNRVINYLLTKKWIQELAEKYDTTEDIINVAANFRRKWIEEKALKVKPNTKIIDVGAGEAPYRELFSQCKYMTHDFMEYKGTSSGISEEKWNYSQIDFVSDIVEIPVDDEFFDVVLCTEVLEHVPDPISALREMSRILAPNGTMLLTVPLSAGLHQEPYHFYGGFTPHFFEMFLTRFNMEITELTPICGLYRHVGQEVYRSGRILLGNSSKKLTLLQRFLFFYWIPNYFKMIEKDIMVKEFTVGYVLEARKKTCL
jgi:ubiquinone/menaquinone biosynthesis C-methylase UbiE